MAQRVTIMTEKRNFTGVIASKPPHVMTSEEMNKVYPMREMYIDVGAHSDKQVKEWGIRVGDPVVPMCPFEILPDDDTILAKALDNRVGCYLALEVLDQLRVTEHPNTVICGATVQEEVGLRGATTTPHVAEPDVAFALDVGVAEDGPGSEGNSKAKLGKGPLITFLDATMIPNVRLRNLVIDTAERNGIPIRSTPCWAAGRMAVSFIFSARGTHIGSGGGRTVHSQSCVDGEQKRRGKRRQTVGGSDQTIESGNGGITHRL